MGWPLIRKLAYILLLIKVFQIMGDRLPGAIVSLLLLFYILTGTMWIDVCELDPDRISPDGIGLKGRIFSLFIVYLKITLAEKRARRTGKGVRSSVASLSFFLNFG